MMRCRPAAQREQAFYAPSDAPSEGHHDFADLLVRFEKLVCSPNLVEAGEGPGNDRLQLAPVEPGEDFFLGGLVAVRMVPDLARHPASHREALNCAWPVRIGRRLSA